MKSFLFKNSFLFLAGALLLYFSGVQQPFSKDSANQQLTSFSNQLHQKEDQTSTILKEYIRENLFKQLVTNPPEVIRHLYSDEGIALLAYENDSLIYWNTNRIPVENIDIAKVRNQQVVFAGNAYLETFISKAGSRTLIGLLLIKNQYPFQNEYLGNSFNPGFDLADEVLVIQDSLQKEYKVLSQQGTYLFSLSFDKVPKTPGTSYLYIISALIGLVLLLVLFNRLFHFVAERTNRLVAIIGYCFVLFILRIASIESHFPAVLYNLPLFGPEYFAAASWLPSLGDLLFDGILCCYVVYFTGIHGYHDSQQIKDYSTRHKLSLATLFILVVIFCSMASGELLVLVIRNSNISFDLSNILSLSVQSYLALLAIALVFLTFYLLTRNIVNRIAAFDLSALNHLLSLGISSALFVGFYCFVWGPDHLLIALWGIPVLFVTWLYYKKRGHISVPGVLILLTIVAAFSASIFSEFSAKKEKEYRKLIAIKLSAEQDPIAEYLFKDVEKKLSTDTQVVNFVPRYWQRRDEVQKYIKEKYFTGYWAKYDVQFTICNDLDSLFIEDEKAERSCFGFFESLINSQGKQIGKSDFYFLNNNSGKISYLSKIRIHQAYDTLTSSYLFIELNSKFVSESVGYPDLLIDSKLNSDRQQDFDYSYAKYKNGKIINRAGEFPYSLVNVYDSLLQEFTFVESEGFSHLLYKINNSTVIILSKEQEDVIDAITYFSYLFMLFGLLLVFLIAVEKLGAGALQFQFSFKNKIQVATIAVLLSSSFIIGGITIYYITDQFNSKNTENISEKMYSVLIEIDSKLSAEKKLTGEMKSYIDYLLVDLSNVFFTDINLYDPSGNLVGTSRPEIFEEGLLSKKMHPRAFRKLIVEQNPELVATERIGELSYLSAYVPFRNQENKIIAYVNLPYFAKQSKLKKEIAQLLVALINIYILLFGLSVLLAIFISGKITEPLMLLQEKFKKMKLGKANEKIAWDGHDEIGALINEYNQMISQLAESAEMLAKSERESAWREMAKQVAHEIKNPLTPMKLSIQHLQRSWKDNPAELEKKIEKFSKTLIEQIDSLTLIADEFSDFAKMPQTKNENISLVTLLHTVVDLYKNTPNVQLRFAPSFTEAIVFADKDQLLRVFGNLVKNAIQAIPNEREGEINIEIHQKETNFVVSITDNGIGIEESQVKNIFVPSFTTKSSGMGLGLSIVRNIVEQSAGKIWFETRPGIGTTFFISLPAWQP